MVRWIFQNYKTCEIKWNFLLWFSVRSVLINVLCQWLLSFHVSFYGSLNVQLFCLESKGSAQEYLNFPFQKGKWHKTCRNKIDFTSSQSNPCKQSHLQQTHFHPGLVTSPSAHSQLYINIAGCFELINSMQTHFSFSLRRPWLSQKCVPH